MKEYAMCNFCMCAFMLATFCGCDPPNPELMRENQLLMTDMLVHEELPQISKTRIKKLQILRATIRKQDMEIIGTFSNLEYLRISECELDEHCNFEPLENLTNLERLTISSNRFADEDLRIIAHMPKLKGFRLGSKSVTGVGFANIESPPDLQSLVLSAPITDVGLKHIADFKNLGLLWLTNSPATDAGLKNLENNVNLVNFGPASDMTDEGLHLFAKQLLESRAKARAAGDDVPEDPTLVFYGMKLEEYLKAPKPLR